MSFQFPTDILRKNLILNLRCESALRDLSLILNLSQAPLRRVREVEHVDLEIRAEDLARITRLEGLWLQP